MDSGRILGLILDIGAAMTRCGAETFRVDDSLYRLCGSYGFQNCNIWVVPSNVQATVTGPEGKCLTQLRHIRRTGVDFDRLDKLNALSRYACEHLPDAPELEERLRKILDEEPPNAWHAYLSGVLAGVGFGLLFHCDWLDALCAAAASVLITFLGRFLSKLESNPLTLNFLISLCTESFIMLSVHLGFGHHTGYITLGVVMLLISGLGTTNGVRDLVHLDTLSGLVNIFASFTGAVGIALGIALPLYLLRSWGGSEPMTIAPGMALQLLACFVSCWGFAVRFHVVGRKIVFCALGAVLTWAVYSMALQLRPETYLATLFASFACGFYAQIMARLNRAPATVFSTVSVFPLIPGASLYYMMYGIVVRDQAFAFARGVELLLTCFAIVLGFMAVETLSRLIWRPRQLK